MADDDFKVNWSEESLVQSSSLLAAANEEGQCIIGTYYAPAAQEKNAANWN